MNIDLEIVITPFTPTFNLNEIKDLTVRVKNVGTLSTTGNTNIVLSSMDGYSINFDTTQTTAPTRSGITNNNLFVLSQIDNNILVSTNTILNPGEIIFATFKIEATTSGASNMVNTILLPANGGESNLANNTAQLAISTL